MSITTQRSITRIIAGFSLLTALCCQSEESIPSVENFAIYTRTIKAVDKTPQGYIILSDTVWFHINSQGQPSEYFGIREFNENFYSSDIIYSNDKVYVLMSVFSDEGKFIDLGVLVFAINGDLLKKVRIKVADSFKAEDLEKVNSNYTLPFPLYAIGIALPSDELLIAFNLIGKTNERWKNILLHLNANLELVGSKEIPSQDFYSWVYDVKPSGVDTFIMSRGGNNWYSIDQFDIKFELRSDVMILQNGGSIGNPVITNILQESTTKFIMTGHADLRNNPDNSLHTNYDFWVMSYDLNDGFKEERFIGSKTNKELCFDSYLTSNNKLVLAGSQRGFNQTSFDLSARIKLVEIDLNQSEIPPQEYLLTDVGGMEAFTFHQNTNQSHDIIGRKFGFDETSAHGFFRTINNYSYE